VSIFTYLSRISRERKLRLFYEWMKPVDGMWILDVGAEVADNPTVDVQLIDGYPWKSCVCAVNIREESVARIKRRYPQIDARRGDARSLPWPDKFFDVVYSNAVIEHVGGEEDQRRMAAEIMRVGKRWFVTTPNRWYPFEFHLRLPLVTWLPRHGYLWFGMLVHYNHVRRRYVFGHKVDGLRLLTMSECRRCFPGSNIVKQRVTFMAETLLVVGGEGMPS
jgi:SAM-dependent methyltransferase